MIKQIFTFLLLFCIGTLTAQQCNYAVDKKDEFTNTQIKETQFQTIVSRAQFGKTNHALHLALSDRNNEENLKVKYQLRQSKLKILRFYKSKASIYFKLADGEVVQLMYGEEDHSKGSEYKRTSKSGGKSTYTMTLDCRFELTAENREKLANSEIEKVRISFAEDDVVEFEIKEVEKSPLLGVPSMGIRLKKTKPRAFFIQHLDCI